MLTHNEKAFIDSLRLILNFDNLTDDDWGEIEDIVADALQINGFDEDYKPTSIGIMCESILDKIPID